MSKPKPFDAAARCPKCGNSGVRSIYEPPISEDPCWYARENNPVGKWPRKEFIRRICDRCRYDWPEMPMGDVCTGLQRHATKGRSTNG